MSGNTLVVLDAATLDLADSYWNSFSEFGTIRVLDHTAYDEDVIIKQCEGAAIVLTNKVPMSARVISALPELQLISILATGYNIVDLEAAKAKNVLVCNVPAYSTESVAQHTLALILELCNRVGHHSDSVYQGDWIKSLSFAYWDQPVKELSEMTVGLLGMGMIAQRVGEMLSGFGCRILGFSRRQRAPLFYKRFEWAASLDELFQKSDIVSLHCPLSSETEGFVNKARFEQMKPSAYLVNTARGPLVNESDLCEALESGVIAGAALDVISREPMRGDNPLLDAPNCIITPHMAWSSDPSRDRLIRISKSNIRGYLNQHPVNMVK